MTKPKDPSLRKGKASKLKEADVRNIRELYASGAQNARELAQYYGVGAETVRRAIRGETWNNLQMAPMRTEEELAADAEASLAKMLAMVAEEKKRLAAGVIMLEEIKTLEPAGAAADPYSWIKRK